MAFRGHFDYSLDAKNRLSIPPRFRAAFADGVVLSKWLEPCVAIWTPREFEGFTESFLPDLNPLSRERRRLASYFAHHSFDVELDSAGRVTLPPALIEHAGLGKEVVVAGNLDHLEVWDRGRWRGGQPDLDAEIVDIAESLGHPS